MPVKAAIFAAITLAAITASASVQQWTAAHCGHQLINACDPRRRALLWGACVSPENSRQRLRTLLQEFFRVLLGMPQDLRDASGSLSPSDSQDSTACLALVKAMKIENGN
jgi:Spy/CpxP family protein refolding chaperone